MAYVIGLFIGAAVVAFTCFVACICGRTLRGMPNDGMHMKKNGCSWPPDPAQLILLTIFSFSEYSFWALCMPTLRRTEAEDLLINVLLGVHCSLVAVAVWFWLRLTCLDPWVGVSTKPLGQAQYCEYCQLFYDGLRRKHCHVCHKCVLGYDHHCTFLNTCVSDYNYGSFLCATIAFLGVLLGQVAFGAYLFIECATDQEILQSFETAGTVVWFSMMCCMELACSLGALFCIVLLAFHMVLWQTGVSTYQYLGHTYDNEKAAEQIHKAYLSPGNTTSGHPLSGYFSRSTSPIRGNYINTYTSPESSRASDSSWTAWGGAFGINSPLGEATPVMGGSHLESEIRLTSSGKWDKAIMFVSGMHHAIHRDFKPELPRVSSANDLSALQPGHCGGTEPPVRRTWPNLQDAMPAGSPQGYRIREHYREGAAPLLANAIGQGDFGNRLEPGSLKSVEEMHEAMPEPEMDHTHSCSEHSQASNDAAIHVSQNSYEIRASAIWANQSR